MSEDCIFCKIVAGEIPGDILERTDRVVAFRDLDPQAPTHALVIPVEHLPDVAAVGRAGGDLLAEMAQVAARIGEAEGHDGWRWVFNSGPDAGQVVFHCHGHVLAGRGFGWPPG